MPKNKRRLIDAWADDKARRFTSVIDADRRTGVTLWQILVFIPGQEENWAAISADPHQFAMALNAGDIDLPRRLNDGAIAGMLVLPVTFEACSETQLAAALTLPRERVFTMQQLRDHGITVELIPKVRWDDWCEQMAKDKPPL